MALHHALITAADRDNFIATRLGRKTTTLVWEIGTIEGRGVLVDFSPDAHQPPLGLQRLVQGKDATLLTTDGDWVTFKFYVPAFEDAETQADALNLLGLR